ncbi:MAG: group II intron reverse transcriptase/maturase [Christensenellales bacterium]
MYSAVVKLYTPFDKTMAKLLEVGGIRIKKDTNGKERWKAIHRKKLINRSDIEILSKYNSEVRGLANYYSLACNPIRMAHFSSLMKYSMLKTFAAKYRTKTSKIKARYLKKGIFTVPYMTKAGPKESVYYNEGFERRKEPLFGQVDMQATYKKYAKPSSLICKLRAKTCELCGTTCDDIEIHQVKRLKDLTGNAEWEQVMRSRHRRTLAVCPNCHEMIHRSNKSQDDGKRRAVCAERCLHGSGGSQ